MDATRRLDMNSAENSGTVNASYWRRGILAVCLIGAGGFVIVENGVPVAAQSLLESSGEASESESLPAIIPATESSTPIEAELPLIAPRANAALDRSASARRRPVPHGHSTTESQTFVVAPVRIKTHAVVEPDTVQAAAPRLETSGAEACMEPKKLIPKRTVLAVSDPDSDGKQPQTRVPPPPVFLPGDNTRSENESASALIQEDSTRIPVQNDVPRAPQMQYVQRPAGKGIYPGVSRYRANNEADAHSWMSPYQQRASHTGTPPVDSSVSSLPPLDPSFQAWWDAVVRSSAGLAANVQPVELHGLVQDAMIYSPQVLAIKAEAHVQYHVVGQEEARFDWTTFLDTTFDDLKDPVGNQLALGNVPGDRLKDRNLSIGGGLRRRNRHGGEFEMSQRIGRQRQNSQFFTPNPQGNSRLELQYRQPVLNGAGAVVNESQIVLARITANQSEDEVVVALQDHLVQVTEAYWTLFRARAEYLQRHKLLQSSEGVLRKLEGRNEVDTIPRQILRARAAVARTQSGIQRALSRIRDAEAQLRLLVNSPNLLNSGAVELTPQISPVICTNPDVLQHSLNAALQNRPDISAAIRQMRSSGVRLGVSRNELLPRLDLIVSSYVSDITASSISRSLNGQFGDARPSYSVGFEFEVPLGNRAAKSLMEQRKWELKRSINVFRATVEKALTDVEVAHREVATAWSEVLSRYQAMTAAQNEASYLQDRFDVLPMAEDSATLLLEDLLDAFERVADEEAAFVQAQVGHAVAIIRLRKEVGTLLRSREAPPTLDEQQARWMTNRIRSLTPENPAPAQSPRKVQQVSGTRTSGLKPRR